MKHKIFLLAFFAIALISCNRKIVSHKKEVTKDSVTTVTETVYKDTTIYIPGDSVYIIDSIPCPDFQSTKTKDNITAKVVIKDKIIRVDCKTDSLKQVIKNLQSKITTRTITRDRIITVNRKVVKTKPPLWAWLVMGIEAAIIFLLIKRRGRLF